MAVADAFGSLNTGKWETGTFAALGEPVPIFFVNIDCVRKMGDRQGRLILVGGKCEQLLKKMAVVDAFGSLKPIEYVDYCCGK